MHFKSEVAPEIEIETSRPSYLDLLKVKNVDLVQCTQVCSCKMVNFKGRLGGLANLEYPINIRYGIIILSEHFLNNQ